MKLIIPMAGRGTRVRPHSHVTPKPLLAVRGKSMVERIVETFTQVLPEPITEAVFVLGPDFGDEVRTMLTEICGRYGIEARFGVQPKALGTAHAVLCAGEDNLVGDGVMVFADTLFYMPPVPSFGDADVVAWVKHVDDPRRFGVAVREGEKIVAFVEKPQELISNEALIGIYYFRDLARYAREAQYLMDHEIKGNGEYQLTDAVDRMLKDGAVVRTATVSEWLDCGTIPALLDTTKVILEKEHTDTHAGTLEHVVVVPPVYVGEGARVARSVIGPYTSIEAGAVVEDSVVRDTVVFSRGTVQRCVLEGSFVGQSACAEGVAQPVNVGDHATVGVVR
jgi:glucose-1-phosphate thymidylyltransferase